MHRAVDTPDADTRVPVRGQQEAAIFGETVGVVGDEVAVERAALEEQPANGVHQGDIAARGDRNVECGRRRRGRPPRVHDDQLDAGVRLVPGLDPVERDRMGLGHVAPPDQHAIAVVDVVVAGRRAVGAQAGAVPGDGRGHAEPAVGVGVVRADRTLEELDRQVRRPRCRAVRCRRRPPSQDRARR